MYWKMWIEYGKDPLIVEADNMDEAFAKARKLDEGYCSAQPMDERETRLYVMSLEYRASEEANRRMMDTTIWQACKILGIELGSASNADVFHRLYEKFYQEELSRVAV